MFRNFSNIEAGYGRLGSRRQCTRDLTNLWLDTVESQRTSESLTVRVVILGIIVYQSVTYLYLPGKSSSGCMCSGIEVEKYSHKKNPQRIYLNSSDNKVSTLRDEGIIME